jgi:hypothetical protein
MCRWYAPGRPSDCDHDRADPPVEKESANFCEFFSPLTGAFAEEEGRKKAGARTKLDSLFGEDAEEDSPEESDSGAGQEDDARSRLDDLFKD